jgi:hypothetical protein
MSVMAVMGFPAAGQRLAGFYRIDNALVMSGESEAFQSVAEREGQERREPALFVLILASGSFHADQDDGEETGQSTSAPR